MSVGEIVVQTLPTIYMRRIAHNLDVEATKKFYQRMTQYFREMMRIAKLTIKEETCSAQVNFELQKLHKERQAPIARLMLEKMMFPNEMTPDEELSSRMFLFFMNPAFEIHNNKFLHKQMTIFYPKLLTSLDDQIIDFFSKYAICVREQLKRHLHNSVRRRKKLRIAFGDC